MSSTESARRQEGRRKRDCPLKRGKTEKENERVKKETGSPLSTLSHRSSSRASRGPTLFPRRLFLSRRDDPVFLLAGDGRYRPDGAGDVRFGGKRAREKRARERETSGDALFVFPMLPLFFSPLSQPRPTKNTGKENKQPTRLRRAARPAPRARHRARGLDHLGVDRRPGSPGRLDDARRRRSPEERRRRGRGARAARTFRVARRGPLSRSSLLPPPLPPLLFLFFLLVAPASRPSGQRPTGRRRP